MTEPAEAVYVHAADDGGILVIDGVEGRSGWVTADDLAVRLAAAGAAGGGVVLSAGSSPVASTIVGLVIGSGVPMVTTDEVHPDAIRPDGLTSLMAHAYVGAVPLVADLVERGVPLDTTDASGYTALMYAANAGEHEVLAILLDAGADADVVDHDGSTAIMFAASTGDLKAVKQLLGHHASAGSHRFDGLTAREIAERNGHDRVAAVLGSAEEQARA